MKKSHHRKGETNIDRIDGILNGWDLALFLCRIFYFHIEVLWC